MGAPKARGKRGEEGGSIGHQVRKAGWIGPSVNESTSSALHQAEERGEERKSI